MGIKIGKFDIIDEILNNKLNIDAVLNILARKGLLTQEEFNKMKKEATDRFQKENPELSKKEAKNNKNGKKQK